MNKYDKNNDGTIDFPEWTEIMRGRTNAVEELEVDDEVQPSLEHRELSRSVMKASSDEAYGILRMISGMPNSLND